MAKRGTKSSPNASKRGAGRKTGSGKKKKGNDRKAENKESLALYLIKQLFIGVFKITYFIVLGVFLLIRSIGRFFYRNFFRPARKKASKRIRKAVAKPGKNYEEFSLIDSLSGSFRKWESKVLRQDSSIGIIIGARGSGKSAFGMKMLENVHYKTEKRCFAIGFARKDLPKWITAADDISQLENDSFVLIDESGILFSSRNSMAESNKMLSELILIARHKSISILFITQNSSNVDINVIRQSDYLVLKPSSLLQMDFERKRIKNIYSEAMPHFERYKFIRGLTYIYSEEFRGFIDSPLPGFWSDTLSKSFK